jgi:hypothetical protein
MIPDRIACFDAESNGLHGEAFAVGAVVLDREGNLLSTFAVRAPDPDPLDPWVREHVMPALATMPVTHATAREMREVFWLWLRGEIALGSLIVADCGWPVETGLLSACVADDAEGRCFRGPYPMHEAATFLEAAGLDPLGSYASELYPEARPHHPVDDARVSALSVLKALRILQERAK